MSDMDRQQMTNSPLTKDQVERLLRIQRMRRNGFLPGLADLDFVVELVGLLLGGNSKEKNEQSRNRCPHCS